MSRTVPYGPLTAVAAFAVLVLVILWLLLDPIQQRRLGVARVQREPVQTVSAIDPRIGTFAAYYLDNDANPFVPLQQRKDELKKKKEIKSGPAKVATVKPVQPPQPPAKPELPRLQDARALMPTVAGVLRGPGGDLVRLRFPEAAQQLGLPPEVVAQPGDSLAGWTLVGVTPAGMVELAGPDGQPVLLPPPMASAALPPGGGFPDPGVLAGRSTTSGAVRSPDPSRLLRNLTPEQMTELRRITDPAKREAYVKSLLEAQAGADAQVPRPERTPPAR
ncbi:MAG: hypothetical protein RLZZ127_920 [Planctomycetota bacterium]|jgi:hypothetical protein